MFRPIFTLTAFLVAALPLGAQTLDEVLKTEAQRVAVCKKVKPTVVAVFAKGGAGGGTGVLISDDGYALTNFHVVQPTGPTLQCGLPHGGPSHAVPGALAHAGG